MDVEELNPLELPPIVMEKVSYEELMVRLLARINASYMPDRSDDNKEEFKQYGYEFFHRPEYNSKPIYIDLWPNPFYNEQCNFINPSKLNSYGIYAIDDNNGIMIAYCGDNNVEFQVNLKTREAIVRVATNKRWYSFSEGQAVSMDRFKLDTNIDVFL